MGGGWSRIGWLAQEEKAKRLAAELKAEKLAHAETKDSVRTCDATRSLAGCVW